MTITDLQAPHHSPLQARLESLIAAYLDLVYASALRQMRDPHQAQDIAQTVFLIAARKHASIPSNLEGAWLLKVTRYAVLNAQRSDRRRKRHEKGIALGEESADQITTANQAALFTALDAALDHLSAADRELIAQRFFQQRSIAHIAQSLHVPDNTISKRLERALAKLRRHLERRGQSIPEGAIATILFSTPLPQAPVSLAPKILSAARAPITVTILSSFSLGILLMSTTAKWILALAILFILLISFAYTVTHSSLPQGDHTAVAPTSSPQNPTTTTLTGTLKDTAGNPLSNAFVSQGSSPFARTGYHFAYTDSDGHFAIPNVRIADNLMLTAIAHGYSPEIVHYGLVTANTPQTPFTLSPGHIIRFRFLDQHNQPLSAVAVGPDLWHMELTDLRTNNFLRRANGNPPYDGMLSGSDGRFVWNSAPADLVDFAFYKTDKYDDYRFVQGQFGPSDHENIIILRDSLKMTVTAVDDQTNALIPDFNCFIGQGDDNIHASNWDASPNPAFNGAWSKALTNVSKFNFIRVEAPGYAPVTKSFPEDLQSVSLPFRLSKSAGLTLTILQPNNQPAATARV